MQELWRPPSNQREVNTRSHSIEWEIKEWFEEDNTPRSRIKEQVFRSNQNDWEKTLIAFQFQIWRSQ